MASRARLSGSIWALVSIVGGAPTLPQGEPPQTETEILGKRSSIQLDQPLGDWARIEAGSEIREQPSAAAGVLEIVAEPTEMEILDRRNGWVRVRHRGRIGWIDLGGSPTDPDEQIPILYSPDENRLLRARSILSDDAEAGRLGPFELYTDVEDPDLLSRLANVATHLDDAYRERFGIDPGSTASEVLVVFSDHDDYLRFEAGEPDIAGTGTRGYTGRGISVLSVGDRPTASTVEILIHELTHILNRRVFGMHSPAWVEEGLADDLAYCEVDARGRLKLGSLGGSSSREISSDLAGRYRVDTELSGGRGMLSNLVRRWTEPERPDLEDLLTLPWIEFIQPEVRPIHYAQSAFFVRFLLSQPDSDRSRGLREYLRALAASSMPDGESLWTYVGEDPAKVESAYYRWLRRYSAANGL